MYTKSPLIRFLIKVVAYSVGWLLVYHILLKPAGQPDQILRNSEAFITTKLLNGVGYEVYAEQNSPVSTVLYSKKERIIGIADSCNGLILFIVFSGLIVCLPGQWKKKLLYIPLGISLIYLLNIIRIFSLTLIQIHAPEWLNFNHHYVFTLIVYGFIFLLWMYYVNKVDHTLKSLTAVSNESEQ